MQNHLAFCQEVKILDPKKPRGGQRNPPPPASLEVNAATAWTFYSSHFDSSVTQIAGNRGDVNEIDMVSSNFDYVHQELYVGAKVCRELWIP